MERNTIIAIVLSLVVLVAYQFFFAKPEPARKPAAEAPREAAPAAPVVPAAPQAPQPSEAAAPARTIRVETDLFIAEISSRGGTLESWRLKEFRDEKTGEPVSLLQPGGVYPALAVGSGGDFSISNRDFHVTGGDLDLQAAGETGSVVFEYAGDGYSIRRTYTFRQGTYLFDLRDEVAGLRDYEITLGGYFGIHTFAPDRLSHTGPVVLSGTDRIEVKAKKLEGAVSYTEDLKWIAEEDKYFFSSIVPPKGLGQARAWKVQDTAVVALVGEAGAYDMKVYAGPKSLDRLKLLGLGLEHIVDFGFFSVIARPIFWLLQKFYALVGNYGWAIVLLTIVVRVPFIPLVNKSQRSMKKMQQISPKMQEIKEKYKKDPQKMQKEMMELYKKNKVNPLGGCLPMLLQIPVFFALYKVLMISIELRDAPWALWITDLSQKDPFYILPIVMGISMVVQQKMTPSAGDPRQQKLMMFMPVIFTFLFLSFPAGLVLYWLVNNLLSIVQQVYVNRKKEA
ncbi:MAG: membrane protein insertase YidC [Thermodesulfovibrionales bacterium]